MPTLLWILLGALLVFTLAALAVSRAIFFRTLARDKLPPPKPFSQLPPEWQAVNAEIAASKARLLEMPHEKPEIHSFDGLTLRARLYEPIRTSAHPPRVVIGVHGYTSSSLNDFGTLAPFYLARGCHVLLPDNRAHGESDGRFIGFGWLDRLDVARWCEWVVRRFGPDCRVMLHGISMGAATVMMTSGEPLPPNVVCAVEDCGYTSAWDEFSSQIGNSYHLPAFPLIPLASLWCRCIAGYGFRECSALHAVEKTRLPMLFIHGEADAFVPARMVHTLYAACRAPKRLFTVPDAKHAMSWYDDRADYSAQLETWMRAYDMLPSAAGAPDGG